MLAINLKSYSAWHNIFPKKIKGSSQGKDCKLRSLVAGKEIWQTTASLTVLKKSQLPLKNSSFLISPTVCWKCKVLHCSINFYFKKQNQEWLLFNCSEAGLGIGSILRMVAWKSLWSKFNRQKGRDASFYMQIYKGFFSRVQSSAKRLCKIVIKIYNTLRGKKGTPFQMFGTYCIECHSKSILNPHFIPKVH